MKCLNIFTIFLLEFAFVSGLKHETQNSTQQDADLMKRIAEDFNGYMNMVTGMPETHQSTPEERKRHIMFVLLTSLMKQRENFKEAAEANHFSRKQLLNYVKNSLISSPEINRVERDLAQIVADKRNISPRFFGNMKKWFVSKTVKMVGVLMSLPPAPKDEDFEDDDYFKHK